MDLGSIAIGMVAGFVVGMLILTPTGREVTGAAGRRTARYINK